MTPNNWPKSEEQSFLRTLSIFAMDQLFRLRLMCITNKELIDPKILNYALGNLEKVILF